MITVEKEQKVEEVEIVEEERPFVPILEPEKREQQRLKNRSKHFYDRMMEEPTENLTPSMKLAKVYFLMEQNEMEECLNLIDEYVFFSSLSN